MPFIETFESNLWLKFLVDATLKSVVIFAFAGVFAFVLRHQSAALRGLVWSMAIVGCLIVPLCSLTLPQWNVGVLPGTSGEHELDVLVETSPPAAMPVSIAPRAPSSNVVSPTQATPTAFQPQFVTSERNASQSNMKDLTALHWTDWIVAGWAVVGLFLFARLVAGIGTVWNISARGVDFNDKIEHLELNLKRRCRVRRSEAVAVPMMWGFFRPVILLPADANGWEAERLRAVLLHELAHVQRRDWLMQSIAQVTCAVYWFNPLVWVVVRQMRTKLEQACDDHVLNAGYGSTEYAQHLLDSVRILKAFGSAPRAAVAMARQSKFEERLRTVLAENRNRRPLTNAVVVIGLLVLIGFGVPMGVMRLADAVDEEDTLYNQIQEALGFHLDSPPIDATDEERATRDKLHAQNWELAFQLCEQFIKTYPESERYDEVFYKRLICLRNLGREPEFEAGVEAFISERPSSKYTSKVRRLRADYLESQFRFDEALAEWDGINDPALLHKEYERKGKIYGQMGNWEKFVEFDLLRAELILGKPAPEFSHTSIDGFPVSLADLRGKVVMLCHWSTRDLSAVLHDKTGGEMSKLKRLYEKHVKNPNFILVNVFTQSSVAELKEFVEAFTMPGIHLLLEPKAVPYQFGVEGCPYYVVLDKAGILRESVHGYELGHLEVQRLIEALLAEDINVSDERIIPRISQLRAKLYMFQDEDENAIAEYEKLTAFTQSPLDLTMGILARKREDKDEAVVLMNQAYDRIVEASRATLDPTFGISHYAVELAKLFAQQGDRVRTWRLFQIAVEANDFNLNTEINYARLGPEPFEAIEQDMSELQNLLAESAQSEADRRLNESSRKLALHAKDLKAAHKSFTAVQADGEYFTGVIISRVGHVLVPASVTTAKVIRVRIVDYLPAKVVAVDEESGLGVVQVHGQRYLRPVVLGSVDALRECALIPRSNHMFNNAYMHISAISARGYPKLSADIHHRWLGRASKRYCTITQLKIDDGGKVTTLRVANPRATVRIVKGDALVYYDGRLLGVSLDNGGRNGAWGFSSDLLPIDRIRTVLERMDLMNFTDEGFERVLEAEDFTRMDGEKPKVQSFLITNDPTTSGGAFIVSNTALAHQYELPESWLAYEIQIPADGDYAIWLYGRAYTGKSDSFFVGTDLETPRACDVNRFGLWGAVPAVDRTSPQVVPAFHFTKGLHEIRLFVRETGTELDAILITNDLSLGEAEINRKFELHKSR